MPDMEDAANVTTLIERVYQEHGCEIIVNGVLSSIKYYLRLIDNTNDFVHLYTRHLIEEYEKGTDIKKVHIDKWLSLLDKS